MIIHRTRNSDPIRAVAFDQEDVLIGNDYGRLARLFHEELGVPLVSGPEFRKILEGHTLNGDNRLFRYARGQMRWDKYWESVAIEPFNIEPSYRNVAKMSYLMSSLVTEVNQEAADLARELNENEHEVHLVTNSCSEIMRGSMDIAKLSPDTNYFDAMKALFVSEDMGARKPEESFFLRYMQRSGLRANEIVFFDNKESNVLAWRKLGGHGMVYEIGDDINGPRRYLQELRYNVKLIEAA